MLNPFFSILTITKNCENEIENTLASVKSQTFTNYEHVVVDGCSKDNTFVKIKNFQSRKIIKKQIRDRNCYEGFNNALKIVKGKFILFLHAGDLFYSRDVLKNIKKKLYLSTNFLIGGCIYYDNKNKIKRVWDPVSGPINKNNSYKIPHTATVVNNKIYKKIGYFNLDYKISSDTDFLIRLSSQNTDYQNYNGYLNYMKLGGISTNNKYTIKKIVEDIKIYSKYFNIIYAVIMYFKKIFFKINQIQLPFIQNKYQKNFKELKKNLVKYTI